MMRKGRHILSHSEEASINLTPLIDVVFVVLIIFILIAPMLELDRIQLAHKEGPNAAAVRENSPISIHVRADNSIWLNNRQVNAKELLFLLKEAHKKAPHKTPQLFHDRKAFFESYQ